MAPPRNRVTLVCAQCGTSFERKRSEVPLGDNAFCRRACWSAYARAHATYENAYPKIGERHAHRIAAEEKLGRPLQPGEVVHHRDEDKRNFAPENLDVLPGQSDHATEHLTGKPSRVKGKRWHLGPDGRRVYT